MIGVGGRFREEAMAQNVWEGFLNVVGVDGVLPVEESGGLRSPLEGEGSAGRDGVVLAKDGANRFERCK